MGNVIKVLVLLCMFLSLFACANNNVAKKRAEVYLVDEGGVGEGLFLVSPHVYSDTGRCTVVVNNREVDCNTSYLVACDLDRSKKKNFCTLVKEIGSDRRSAYPEKNTK